MYSLLRFDYFLTDLLNKLIPHNVFFDYFFSFFSLKGASILVWLLVIVIVAILEERKNPGISKQDKKFIILFSLSFLLTAILSDIILKNIFIRPRPFSADYLLPIQPTRLIQPILTCPLNFSFPSTHAATAFAVATVLTFFDKKRRWFYYLTAIIISYSRIYLGCHYFFDVLSGSIIGYTISKLILKNNFNKWLPH